jgi:2-oxo-4-hydroxy-4-carboxy-5-ureidoimidazoline decarboxylase
VTLNELNALPAEKAERALLQCCGAKTWAAHMTRLRPFETRADVLAAADRVWPKLSEADWLEAFAAHPRIGEPSESAWSRREQAAVYTAVERTRRALAAANAEYEKRFGFTYIVFASGKTPEEMLELLQQRLDNPREVELKNAAAEQIEITRLRLERLLDA